MLEPVARTRPEEMPVVQFGPAQWTTEQEDNLLEHRRRFKDPNEARLIGLFHRFEEWGKAQDPSQLEKWDHVDRYTRFVLHIYPGVKSSTTNAFDTLARYQVRLDDIPGAVARLKAHYVKVCLKKWASTHELTKTPTRTLGVLSQYVLLEGEHSLEIEYRVFWYGLLVTGNRVPCMVNAKRVTWDADGTHMIVKWARRKKDRTETTFAYPLAWSFRPPADVVTYIRKNQRFWPRGWKLSTSSLNSYLRLKRIKMELGSL